MPLPRRPPGRPRPSPAPSGRRSRALDATEWRAPGPLLPPALAGWSHVGGVAADQRGQLGGADPPALTREVHGHGTPGRCRAVAADLSVQRAVSSCLAASLSFHTGGAASGVPAASSTRKASPAVAALSRSSTDRASVGETWVSRAAMRSSIHTRSTRCRRTRTADTSCVRCRGSTLPNHVIHGSSRDSPTKVVRTYGPGISSISGRGCPRRTISRTMRSTPMPCRSATRKSARSCVRALFRDIEGWVMMFPGSTPPKNPPGLVTRRVRPMCSTRVASGCPHSR